MRQETYTIYIYSITLTNDELTQEKLKLKKYIQINIKLTDYITETTYTHIASRYLYVLCWDFIIF